MGDGVFQRAHCRVAGRRRRCPARRSRTRSGASRCRAEDGGHPFGGGLDVGTGSRQVGSEMGEPGTGVAAQPLDGVGDGVFERAHRRVAGRRRRCPARPSRTRPGASRCRHRGRHRTDGHRPPTRHRDRSGAARPADRLWSRERLQERGAVRLRHQSVHPAGGARRRLADGGCWTTAARLLQANLGSGPRRTVAGRPRGVRAGGPALPALRYGHPVGPPGSTAALYLRCPTCQPEPA